MADTGIPSGQKLSKNIDANISKQVKFNKELDITLQKANAILKAFGMPQMGGGSGGAGGSLTTSGTFTGGGGSGSSIANFAGRAATTIAGIASGAAQALPGVQDVLSTQLLTSQARFSGVTNPIATAQAAMRGGQATSPTDFLQAIQIGNQGGLTGALPGYAGIANGVSQISNLTGNPQSAMRAAVGLNSAQSVNTLRTFGIQARGSNGAARPASEVFKDIYNFASQQVGRKLTPEDVAIGLQPGNGLANFLDSAAAGNSDLRNALQLAAQQFAKGGDLTRASTNKTGATTAAQGAQSNLFASQLGLQNAAAPAMSQGFIEAAGLLSKFNQRMTDTLASSKLANDAVKQLAKAETIAADNIGKAGLSVLAVLASSGLIGGIAGIAAKGAKSIVGGAAGFVGRFLGIGAAEAAGAEAGAFAGPAGIGLGLIGGFIAEKVISGLHRGSTGNGGGATVTSSPQSSVGSSFAGSAAIMVAQTQLGTPYSWGGGSNSGPTTGIGSGTNTRGFDCSSFVRFVMSKLGIVLPRTSQEQQKCGTQISPMDAQPGDLLFIGNPAHHVMIYAGNGIAIEAPQTGDVVKRTGVDLRAITSCSRVINSKTGTKDLGNLLNSSNGLQGFGNYVGGAQVSINELRGNTPKDAMSGGTSSSSGLGLGAEQIDVQAHTAMRSSQNAIVNASGQPIRQLSKEELNARYQAQRLAFKERMAVAHMQSGDTNINYGGITVDVKVPSGTQVTAQDIAKAVKAELKSLSISTKVAAK
jgi:cell wall-associated NlpC family hydrolase